MKEIDGKRWYKIGEVTKMVERSASTIIVWYDAAEYAAETGHPFPFVLPKFRQDIDSRKTRYWSESGVEMLIKFRDSVMKGDLSFYTRGRMWSPSEREKITQDKKDFKNEHGIEELVDEY